MKRLIAAIALTLLVVVPAFAGLNSNQLDSAGWKNLSEAEKAVLIKQVADQAAKNKAAGFLPTEADSAKVSQWVDVGERIGKMIGSVAKEVGVAVNDFVQTPVGKMAMLLVVWHYMGGVLVHLIGGLLVLIVGLSFILYMMKRARTVTYEYDSEKTDLFGRSRLKSIRKSALDDGYVAGFTISAAVVIVASLITVFTF